ncbi:hypothetical protein ScPMuIL_012194, partial [Solemya velum]
QKFQYDLITKEPDFKVGDKVWVAYPKGVNRQCKKFAKPWQGPFIVTRKVSSVVYTVQPYSGGRKRGRLQTVHVNRLKSIIVRESAEPEPEEMPKSHRTRKKSSPVTEAVNPDLPPEIVVLHRPIQRP